MIQERLRGVRLRTVALSVALLLASMQLASCANAKSENAGEPTASTSQARIIADPAQVSRPADAYLLDAQAMAAFNRAFSRQMRLCTQGSETASRNADDFVASSSEAVRARAVRSPLWGYFAPNLVATYGYEPPPDQRSAIEVDFGGSPTASAKCESEVAKRTAGADLFPDATSLPDGGPEVPTTDSRVVAVFKSWSSCMSTKGFTYPDPSTAFADGMAKRIQQVHDVNAPVSAGEIALATADIACKISTNLVGIAVAVQAAYDNRYIDQHVTQLAAYKATLQKFTTSS